jgi:hypothetical protein
MNPDQRGLLKQMIEDMKAMEGRGGADNLSLDDLLKIRDSILGGEAR